MQNQPKPTNSFQQFSQIVNRIHQSANFEYLDQLSEEQQAKRDMMNWLYDNGLYARHITHNMS